MEASEGQAAPESGNAATETATPTFEELAADPEIAALLDFDPVPRQLQKTNGWTAPMQRIFIAWLAHYGSAGNAAQELGKARSGIDKIYKQDGAESFRAAWDGAMALAERRQIDRLSKARSGAGAMNAPTMTRRKAAHFDGGAQTGPKPGEVRNERGEWEDEHSFNARAEDAKDSIGKKLLRARRLFLQEISVSAGKRAAFEILTELPVDWEKAKRGEPQDDEPYRSTNQRQPDMILTAESGWSMGEIGYGPGKIAQLRASIDEHRASEGLPPVEWGESADAESPSLLAGEGRGDGTILD
jgi:hypothetical protein